MAGMWNELSRTFSEVSYYNATPIIILAATVLWLLLSSVSRNYRTRDRLPVPPGSFGFPFIGQTVGFILSSKTSAGNRQWLEQQRDKYGPLFKWRFIGYPLLTMVQAEGNKWVFQNEGTSNHIFWPFHFASLFGPDSTFVKSGEQHKLSRRYLNAFFDHAAVSRYLNSVERNAVLHFAEHWQEKDELLALNMTHLYTFSTICNLLISLQDGPQMDELLEYFDRWAKGLNCFPINLPGFTYYKALKARKWILEMLGDLLQQRRREIADGRVSAGENMDILSSLLTVPDEKGNLPSDSYIKDNLLLILIAGFDTSSTTLALVIYFIAKNPHVYEQLVQEHKLILEKKRDTGREDQLLTKEDISAMKYTWRVVQETLRMQPATFGSFRKTTMDLEYKGYRIPKGWLLNWNSHCSHYNPQYFKDPFTFDPSRWEKPPVPFSYLPFGGGSHICLGNEFAKMEMLVFIHHLVRRYRWSLIHPNEEIIRDPFPRTRSRTFIRLMKVTN
ncbi:hypothetical protein R1flu_023315 [Riccia fluitans]|uniref:Cytochrome P450 n=1 Tax=Riccia fluitans TaxID=41844 RepID=A0ABD1XVR9_9MARC